VGAGAGLEGPLVPTLLNHCFGYWEVVVTKPSRAKAVVPPQTLGQAHSDVLRRRPPLDSTLVVQRKFHQDNKRLYESVADIDRGHHHEILYWVQYERHQVEALTEQIRKGQTANTPQ
jgi:hypothetical protein